MGRTMAGNRWLTWVVRFVLTAPAVFAGQATTANIKSTQDRTEMALRAEGPCTPIDFETIPQNTSKEGLLIDDQFAASHGIRFRLEPQGAPRLAGVGAPLTGFEGPRRQPDAPAPNQGVGNFFLTDDGVLSRMNVPPLVVAYDPPTNAASGVVLDIDFDEMFTIEARDAGGKVRHTITIKAGDPGTGDGIATRWSI